MPQLWVSSRGMVNAKPTENAVVLLRHGAWCPFGLHLLGHLCILGRFWRAVFRHAFRIAEMDPTGWGPFHIFFFGTVTM